MTEPADPPSHLESPPPGFQSIAAKAQSDMLRTEAKTLRDLRGHNQAAVAAVIAAILLSSAGKRGIVHAVGAAATTLRDATTATVAAGRGAARGIAQTQFGAELKKIGSVVGTDVQVPIVAGSSRDHDAALASSAGEVASAAFRATMLGAALREPDGPLEKRVAAVRTAGATLDGRARRTATTEVSTALSAEHAGLVAKLAKDARYLPLLALMSRRWDSKLDRYVCPRCRKHEGELTAVGGKFKNGDEPGDIHANCRCIGTLVALPGARAANDTGAVESDVAASSEVAELAPAARAATIAKSAEVADVLAVDEVSAAVAAEEEAASVEAAQVPTSGPRAPISAETMKELGIRSNERDFDANIRKVFSGPGERIPSVEDLEAAYSGPAGYTTKLRSASTYNDGRVVFRLDFGENGGRDAGMTRTFSRDADNKLHVHHDFFELPTRLQGKGIGETMLTNAISKYDELGVSAISVDAHWVGRYTWARFGFTWDAEFAKDTVAPKLARYLQDELAWSSAKATKLARSVARRSWSVAELEADGRKIGKEFLLAEDDREQLPHWEGELRLDDKTHPSYLQAKKRLKLGK